MIDFVSVKNRRSIVADNIIAKIAGEVLLVSEIYENERIVKYKINNSQHVLQYFSEYLFDSRSNSTMLYSIRKRLEKRAYFLITGDVGNIADDHKNFLQYFDSDLQNNHFVFFVSESSDMYKIKQYIDHEIDETNTTNSHEVMYTSSSVEEVLEYLTTSDEYLSSSDSDSDSDSGDEY